MISNDFSFALYASNALRLNLTRRLQNIHPKHSTILECLLIFTLIDHNISCFSMCNFCKIFLFRNLCTISGYLCHLSPQDLDTIPMSINGNYKNIKCYFNRSISLLFFCLLSIVINWKVEKF